MPTALPGPGEGGGDGSQFVPLPPPSRGSGCATPPALGTALSTAVRTCHHSELELQGDGSGGDPSRPHFVPREPHKGVCVGMAVGRCPPRPRSGRGPAALSPAPAAPVGPGRVRHLENVDGSDRRGRTRPPTRTVRHRRRPGAPPRPETISVGRGGGCPGGGGGLSWPHHRTSCDLRDPCERFRPTHSDGDGAVSVSGSPKALLGSRHSGSRELALRGGHRGGNERCGRPRPRASRLSPIPRGNAEREVLPTGGEGGHRGGGVTFNRRAPAAPLPRYPNPSALRTTAHRIPALPAPLRAESRRRPPRPRCPSGRTHLRRRRRGRARRAAAAAAARGRAGGRGRRSLCSARAAAHGPAPAAPGKFAVRFRRLPPRSRAPPRGDAPRSWELG